MARLCSKCGAAPGTLTLAVKGEGAKPICPACMRGIAEGVSKEGPRCGRCRKPLGEMRYRVVGSNVEYCSKKCAQSNFDDKIICVHGEKDHAEST